MVGGCKKKFADFATRCALYPGYPGRAFTRSETLGLDLNSGRAVSKHALPVICALNAVMGDAPDEFWDLLADSVHQATRMKVKAELARHKRQKNGSANG
jgi:hypothetical protein